jgi:hypothetical protein
MKKNVLSKRGNNSNKTKLYAIGAPVKKERIL